jgi:Na+-driven multidrug efflux pump
MQAVGYGAGTLLHACFRELVFYIPFMYLLNSLAGTYGLVCALIAGEGCGAVFALLLIRRWNRQHLRAKR